MVGRLGLTVGRVGRNCGDAQNGILRYSRLTICVTRNVGGWRDFPCKGRKVIRLLCGMGRVHFRVESSREPPTLRASVSGVFTLRNYFYLGGCVLCAAVSALGQTSGPPAKVQSTQGTVDYSKAATTNWNAARVGQTLAHYDRIRTRALSEALSTTLRDQFSRELEASSQRLREALAPYTRFVRVESERVGEVRATLERLREETNALRRTVESGERPPMAAKPTATVKPIKPSAPSALPAPTVPMVPVTTAEPVNQQGA